MHMRAQQRTALFAVIAASAAAFMLAPAGAQPPATSPQPPATSPTQSSEKKVDLTMEQRHIVKEIIVKELKVAPPSAASVPTAVGAVVPAGVPLQPIPVEVSSKVPQIRMHSFVVKDESVVIVDPKDNRIAALVD
jgi:hypothetical protein